MDGGLFVTHLNGPRVMRHFQRLVDETEGLVEWQFVYNPTNRPEPQIDRHYPDPRSFLPLRYEQMLEAGKMVGAGFLDLMLIPLGASSKHPHNWVVEFDVDYAGNWRDFFLRVSGFDSDLLTTTLMDKYSDPDWYWWDGAVCPYPLPAQRTRRAFMPIMRISQRFVSTYRQMVEQGWGGHYEFLFPTIAGEGGLMVHDLGGARPGQKEAGLAAYTNTPHDSRLYPGTFRWRPPFNHYFHEAPAAFVERNKLYHPIKVAEETGSLSATPV
jgi:hypothetical protein